MPRELRRNISLAILFFVLILSLIKPAHAFGVSAPYWKENPLNMQPGQTREVTFLLQNMVGDEDYIATASLEQPNPYVRFKDEKPTYEVPAKTKDVPVTIIISVPPDAQVGSTMPVAIAFKTGKKGGEQQVALGIGITKYFDLYIHTESSPEQKEIPASTTRVPQKTTAELLAKPIMNALVILVITFIIWFLIRRSKKRKATSGENARW